MISSLLPVRIRIAFLCWAALLPVPVKGVSIVVPNSLANTEAGNNNTFPFSISSSGLSSQRYANGNLLMDVWNYSGGSSTYFDLIHSFGDSVCRLCTLLPNGVNQTTGMTDSSGLVTEFTIIPPTLSLNNSLSNIVLSWPSKAAGWHLQSAASPSGQWSDFAATIQVQGRQQRRHVPAYE